MILSGFDNLQSISVIAGFTLIISSVVFLLRNQYRTAVILLILGAVGIYLFSALLDPFLNLWDERFHALVAKNL